MSALNTLVDGYYTLTVGTVKYPMRSIIDLQLQADFARWNFERAVDDLAYARKLYTEAEFEAERQKLREDFRKGLFGFKSKRGAEAMTSLPGLTFICARLIEGVDEITVMQVLVDGVEQAKELLKEIITDSFPELRSMSKKKETMTATVKPKKNRRQRN